MYHFVGVLDFLFSISIGYFKLGVDIKTFPLIKVVFTGYIGNYNTAFCALSDWFG
jgi:hypothetical protein